MPQRRQIAFDVACSAAPEIDDPASGIERCERVEPRQALARGFQIRFPGGAAGEAIEQPTHLSDRIALATVERLDLDQQRLRLRTAEQAGSRRARETRPAERLIQPAA